MPKIIPMTYKKIPEIVSRNFVYWKPIERNDLNKDRYSISSNGEIIDNNSKELLKVFKRKNTIHKFVTLQRKDNTMIVCNVTLLLMKAFVSDDLCSRNNFYFKNRDCNDLYIRNIGICKTNVMSLLDKDIHIICTLLEIGTDIDNICACYNHIRTDIMKKFINDIKNRKIKIDISSTYKF